MGLPVIMIIAGIAEFGLGLYEINGIKMNAYWILYVSLF